MSSVTLSLKNLRLKLATHCNQIYKYFYSETEAGSG